MTFTEAAAEVLRLVGKPLHYREIAEIAIERNLLSHVGKTPEITMSSRLATMVKKDRGEAPIIKIKPGVFGLRGFAEDVLRTAEKESGHDYKLPDPEAEETEAAVADVEEPAEAKETSGDEDAESDEPAAEVDAGDQPIMGALDDDESGKKKRRRRRRGRRDEEEGSPRESSGRESSGRESSGRESSGRESSGRESSSREPSRDRKRRRDSEGSDRGRDRKRGRDRDRSRGRREVSGDWHHDVSPEDTTGSALSDAAFDVLSRSRMRPMTYGRIAELLVQKNKLHGNPVNLVPTVAAAVESERARSIKQSRRPRFRVDGDAVALTDWSMPREALGAERDAERAAEKQRTFVRKEFQHELSKLPLAGFAQLIATWLNAEGVQGLHAVRPPNGARGMHLAGSIQKHLESSRLGVLILRGGQDVTSEHVIEMRGALHHYDQAQAAWIITTGDVRKEAREEAQAKGTIPVTLVDGNTLAKAMEQFGIGIVVHTIPVLTMDLSLLENLGAGVGANKRAELPRGETDGEEQEKGAEGATEEGEAAAADASGDEGEAGGRRRRGRRRRGKKEEESEEASAEAGADGADAVDSDAVDSEAVDSDASDSGDEVLVSGGRESGEYELSEDADRDSQVAEDSEGDPEGEEDAPSGDESEEED